MLHTYILRVLYNCGIVLVFWFGWEIVFGVTYILSVQYSYAAVSVFWLWWEIVLKMRTPFDFLWAVFTKESYWVTLLWSTSRCVYFIRPYTLLLCIFLFCIFLLYHTDPQVEVQIRILLKDKYVKLCQNANTGNHTMNSCTQFLRSFLLGFFILILQKYLASQGMFLIRSKLSITAYLFLAFYGSTALQSRSFLKNIETFLCK